MDYSYPSQNPRVAKVNETNPCSSSYYLLSRTRFKLEGDNQGGMVNGNIFADSLWHYLKLVVLARLVPSVGSQWEEPEIPSVLDSHRGLISAKALL